MTSINSITLEVPDVKAAEEFYKAAFDEIPELRFAESDKATSGFRGFTLSTIVSQPSTVNSLFESAVAAGATVLSPVSKSLWGVGGVIQTPDGAIFNIATSNKKDSGPATRKIDSFVLLIGAEDVRASKKLYVEKGFEVGKSFGNYVEFTSTPVGLGLYKRKALAKVSAVSDEGTGSHRIIVGSDAGAFTDSDGFVWS
jgi:catechol 2,3-dioxygenase-like lactoylglutathione lyase family enzyme